MFIERNERIKLGKSLLLKENNAGRGQTTTMRTEMKEISDDRELISECDEEKKASCESTHTPSQTSMDSSSSILFLFEQENLPCR